VEKHINAGFLVRYINLNRTVMINLKILKALKNLKLSINTLKTIITSKLGRVDFVGAIGNRSESESGPYYLASVQKAISNYKNFSKFKLDPRYQAILEHCTQEQGEAYLKIIKTESPTLISKINIFKENDIIGGAKTYNYKDIGAISPSTLRYLKVASDISNIFGETIGDRIAEIGVGYGGQLLIADKVLKFKQYDLFDLPPVLALTMKYIESHTLNGSYYTTTLNQHRGDVEYDLVISNYAFSELPSKLQFRYIEKILSKSKRGYLTMNSGKENSAFKKDKLSLADLEKFLPSFEILEEKPLTQTDNYIIVWGRRTT
jgi:putative sugar O-methyltransferase